MNNGISQKIKMLRKNKNLSQAGLGIALGVSRAKISNWELGRRAVSIKDAVQIANYFHITIEDLLNLQEEK